MELPVYVNASKRVLPDLINLSKVGVFATDEISGSISQVSCVGK